MNRTLKGYLAPQMLEIFLVIEKCRSEMKLWAKDNDKRDSVDYWTTFRARLSECEMHKAASSSAAGQNLEDIQKRSLRH